jgi:signal transduction histidine kinase
MKFDEVAALTIHDVKNRLALMASHAETRGDKQTVRDALEAATMLTHLLLFYKAEVGSLGVNINARVPADLLEEFSMSFSNQDSISVTADASKAPTLWYYDENLVRLSLMDAVYNALRYAKSKIEITAQETDNYLEFLVHDDGPGFPPEMLGEPSSIQTVNCDGTGLGLHLASHIASLHKSTNQIGSIELSNNNGAVFCLRLPQ